MNFLIYSLVFGNGNVIGLEIKFFIFYDDFFVYVN